jgi:UDP-3-O-[3-hydroxymyristoyl] glucosamine N-acyltransferase
MKLTVSEIAKRVGGKVIGSGEGVVTGLASLETAGPGQATFARREHLKAVPGSRATAVLVPEAVEGAAPALVLVENPYFAFGALMRIVEAEQRDHPAGVHPTAVIGRNVMLGKDVGLGAHAVIGDDCVLGAGARIYPNTTVGARCRIGAETIIYSNVAVREDVTIGRRTIIHSNCSIGGDGFGYLQVERKHVKVPQVGGVEIGDDVEIGCNCTIDRATLDKTVIENGVKIDNHSHIAHNCRVGEDSMLIAYARMGGSTVVGRNVLMAEDVGLTNGIRIGDRCIIGGASKVSRSWPDDSVILGTPAQRMEDEKRQYVLLKRLPRMYETLKRLEEEVEALKRAHL